MLALSPAAALAVTVDQIVALSKAGVSEPIILALIDRDKTILTIEPSQLVSLKSDGVSDAVIVAMLRSGRAEAEAAANANAAFNAATIMSALSTEPILVIVGHGPDRPNTGHHDGFYSGPPAFQFPLLLPYSGGFAPYAPYEPDAAQSSNAPRVEPLTPSPCLPFGPAPSVTPWRLGTGCSPQTERAHRPMRRRTR